MLEFFELKLKKQSSFSISRYRRHKFVWSRRLPYGALTKVDRVRDKYKEKRKKENNKRADWSELRNVGLFLSGVFFLRPVNRYCRPGIFFRSPSTRISNIRYSEESTSREREREKTLISLRFFFSFIQVQKGTAWLVAFIDWFRCTWNIPTKILSQHRFVLCYLTTSFFQWPYYSTDEHCNNDSFWWNNSKEQQLAFYFSCFFLIDDSEARIIAKRCEIS